MRQIAKATLRNKIQARRSEETLDPSSQSKGPRSFAIYRTNHVYWSLFIVGKDIHSPQTLSHEG